MDLLEKELSLPLWKFVDLIEEEPDIIDTLLYSEKDGLTVHLMIFEFIVVNMRL